MSKMFDYISGKTDGEVARLEAEQEHALGYLDLELEENQKLRAESASLRERVRVLEQTLTTVEARCDYMTENDLQPTSADLSDISSLCHAAANEPIDETKSENFS